jgi:hypothetical protein
MRQPITLPEYRLPDLSQIQRQYIVRDDRGRYGVAYTTGGDTPLWARPVGIPAKMGAPAEMMLPLNAILMTSTGWHLEADGTYSGWWSDDDVPVSSSSPVPEKYIRHLVIVDDLGYRIPDYWADVALAGSDQMGHWDYGATLGKVGGEPPVKGQKSGEMTVEQAQDYAKEVGEQVTARGIRLAAKNGYIPNARKLGRDWLITYEGFNHYLDNRPKRGPKRQPTRGANGE